MKTLQKIHNYLIDDLGIDLEEVEAMDSSSVYIAQEIAMYAHRGQYRENGELYIRHPLNCLDLYRRFVGIVPDDYFCMDKDLMEDYGIPYDGVQEVCLLHDVLEDTDVSMDDIAEVFYELGLTTYFNLYIKKPLELITHDKSMSYEDYITIVLEHPISALVKMIDMTDNSNLLGLRSLDEEKIARTKRYIDYIKRINDHYHFIENSNNYLIEFHSAQ